MKDCFVFKETVKVCFGGYGSGLMEWKVRKEFSAMVEILCAMRGHSLPKCMHI